MAGDMPLYVTVGLVILGILVVGVIVWVVSDVIRAFRQRD